MLIKAKTIGIFNRQSLKFIIISHFMAWSHFVGTNWYGLTINLNSSNCIHQSIQFKEILWWRFDLNTGFRYKNIFNFFFISFILISLIFLYCFLFSFYENFIWLTNEHSTELINIIAIFLFYLCKLGKIKIASTAPVKCLSWEFITSFKI